MEFELKKNEQLSRVLLKLHEVYTMGTLKYAEENYKEALEIFMSASKFHDTASELMIALMYDLGQGVERNYYKAIEWYMNVTKNRLLDKEGLKEIHKDDLNEYERKAIQTHLDLIEESKLKAYHNIGLSYKLGRGVKKDIYLARYWFRKASVHDDPDSLYELGSTYNTKEASEDNSIEQFECFQKASSLGHVESIASLALCYSNDSSDLQNKKRAYRLFQLAAAKGSSTAYHNLGLHRYSPSRFELDFTKSVKWLRMGAEKGNVESMYELANLFQRLSYPIDSFRWFLRAAKNGKVIAFNDIGLLYKSGSISFRVNKDTFDVYEDYENRPELQFDAEARKAEAFKWFEEGAHLGCILAKENLADCYFTGTGVECDYQKALDLYLVCVSHDMVWSLDCATTIVKDDLCLPENPDEVVSFYVDLIGKGITYGIVKLGLYFLNGPESKRNYSYAKNWFKKGADLHEREALYYLGLMYKEGRGIDIDYDTAYTMFLEAAHLGHTESQYNVGLFLQMGYTFRQSFYGALNWYKKAANQGHTDAYVNIGYLYDYGLGVEQDIKEAISYYRKAADAKNATGLYNMGLYHRLGRGLEQDYAEALSYFNRAKELGDSRSYYEIARMYEFGEGADINYDLALEYYKEAANLEHIDSMLTLGSHYERGRIVDQSFTEALYWYSMAASCDDCEAQYMCGMLHQSGHDGIPTNYEMSHHYWEMASKGGHTKAPYQIAMDYYNGVGVPQDYREAIKWFKVAVDNYNTDARLNLGKIYYYGLGIPPDFEEAYRWFDIAIYHGQEEAKEYMEQLKISIEQIQDPQEKLRMKSIKSVSNVWNNAADGTINNAADSTINNAVVADNGIFMMDLSIYEY